MVSGKRGIRSEDVHDYYLCSNRWNPVWVQTEDIFLKKISEIFEKEASLSFVQKTEVLELARCFTKKLELLSIAKYSSIYEEDEIYVNFRQRLNLT